jgi:hypothetical protein
MKGVRVDPATGTVRAQAGVTWGELDHETQSFGLATTGGIVSTTGISGLTLGGGIGWLMRKYGLTCDNLLSVDVVTADGQCEVLRFYRDYCAAAPNELTTLASFTTAPPEAVIPASLHGTLVLALVVCHCGSPEQAEEVLRPLQALGSPAARLLGPMPYSALQMMFDTAYPAGQHYYCKSDYVTDLTDEVIEALIAHALGRTSPLSAIDIHQMGGAVKRVGSDATAFGHRDAPFLVNTVASWSDP